MIDCPKKVFTYVLVSSTSTHVLSLKYLPTHSISSLHLTLPFKFHTLFTNEFCASKVKLISYMELFT